MTLTTYTLDGVSHYGDDQLSDILEANLKTFYDWAFLSIGAWTDVNSTIDGLWGGDWDDLRLVEDPSYTDGQVWEGAKKDWVWETGINYIDVTGSGPHNPTPVGTPSVNSIAHTGGYHINYPLGRVIFDTPQGVTDSVQIDYAYKNVQVYRADDAPWYKELQFRSFRVDSDYFQQQGDGSYLQSGDWSVGGNHRIQMPCIILGVTTPSGPKSAYEIGNKSLYMRYTVQFGVIAETSYERNKIRDMLLLQSHKVLKLFDNNLVTASGAWPLDYRGELIGSNMYPDLVENYYYANCEIDNDLNAQARDIDTIHSNLYHSVVIVPMDILFGQL